MMSNGGGVVGPAGSDFSSRSHGLKKSLAYASISLKRGSGNILNDSVFTVF